MRSGRALLATVLALAVCWAASVSGQALAARPPVPARCANANLLPSRANAPVVAAATLCLVDQIRASRHLPPLWQNRELGRVASGQVATMLARNYFSDVRPTGQTPMSLVSRTSYTIKAPGGISVAQNIAWATGRHDTPARIVAAWMASPAHREVILSAEFHDAGVGVAASLPQVLRAGRGGATYAMEFGVRRP
jgi:uncharacterized protein YkwD